MISNSHRWDPYFFTMGEKFKEFWIEYLNSSEKNILIIISAGFDPRTALACEAICRFGGSGRRDVFIVDIDEGPESYSNKYINLKLDNLERIRTAVDSRGLIHEQKVRMWSDDERPHRVGSRRINQAFDNSEIDLSQYSDIILDISAFPRSLFFPFGARFITQADIAKENGEKFPNLHVIVASDPALDECIEPEGIDDEATPITGYTTGLDLQSNDKIPKVWFPLLEPGREEHLKRIQVLVRPDEIVPVLPWPSKNPRRGDDILTEYQRYLYEILGVEPKNTLYIPEENPFSVFRQIYKSALHYNDALKPVGGCTIVISALSNKVSSMGALLAAYELKRSGYAVAIVEVEARGYSFKTDIKPSESNLVSLWITGESYE